MRDDDARSAICQCIGEHLPRVDWGTVYQPDRHDPYIKNFVGPVDGDGKEMLLLTVCKMPNQRENICRCADLQSFGLDTSSSELHGGKQQSGFGVSNAIEVREILNPDTQPLFVENLGEFSGKRHYIHLRAAFT